MFPEADFTFRYWDHAKRPLLKNSNLHLSYTDRDYDVFVFSELWFDFTKVRAKRKVFVRHMTADVSDWRESDRLFAIAEACDLFVCVSEHKRKSLGDLAMHSKIRVAGFGIETDVLRPPDSPATHLFGSAHVKVSQGLCISRLLPDLCKSLPGFLMIGRDNECVDCCETFAPASYQEYVQALQGLGVFVHVVCGNNFGFTPLEALSCGIPVVTGHNDDIPDWLRFSGGIFISPFFALDDPQWMVNCANKIAADDTISWHASTLARETILEHATLDHARIAWEPILFGEIEPLAVQSEPEPACPIYRIIDPNDRNRFPDHWQGFDLTGMIAGQRFVGCYNCGVQFSFDPDHTAFVNQCSNCLGTLKVFTVGQNELLTHE